MRYLFFTKMVRELPIPRLIEALQQIGADGADLCVRDGYPVHPGNARRALPEAVRRMREAGLEVPMVTAATDLTSPTAEGVEALFTACHDAQVPHIKLGYWLYRSGDYWQQVEAARRDLAGFEQLALRWGVKACLHTHSGSYLGVNAAAAMHLARGCNPAAIGVYLDPGHLAINGEPLPLAFAMAGEYLSLLAIKDSRWEKGEDGKPWRAHFLPLGEGMVDWAEMLRLLAARAYGGPLSFHSEYDEMPTDALLVQTRKDIAFLRRLARDTPGKA